MNAFFTTYPMAVRDSDTWRKYAYALGMWLSFLALRGQLWPQAAPAGVEAFKFWRMTHKENPRRVAAGTVKGNLVALNVFYAWAARHHRVTSPWRCGRCGRPPRAGRWRRSRSARLGSAAET